jgi:hypothetical protein
MNGELAWLDMVDQLEGVQLSNRVLLANIVACSLGCVTTIRTYEKGVLVGTVDVSTNVLG